MKQIYTVLLALCASLFATTAMADDATLTKCYGDVSVQGYGAKGYESVSAATLFTADETAPFVGGKITKVRAYIAATNMTSLEIWVKKNVNDKEKLFSQTLTSVKAGWNEVALSEAVTITADMPVALGYTYTQSTTSPAYALTFSGNMCANGNYLGLGDTDLEDYSEYYGALSIEASMTDVTIDKLAANVTGLSLSSSFYTINSNATAKVSVINTGKTINSLTLRLTCGDKSFDTEVTETMAFNTVNDFEADFTTPAEVNLNAEVSATIVAINGEPYQGNSKSAAFSAFEKIYDRNVVIEEGTGTWCGWCVRGIVAMEQMNAKHPDSFIGIAAHTSSTVADPMNLSGYANSLGINGFPGCTLDRVPAYQGLDVDPEMFEIYYQVERARATYADFQVSAAINANNKIEGLATATFDFDKKAADVRMSYVVVEDGVTGYTQTNYYAGGGYGEMGGFESKPQTVRDIVFNDVARALYPSFKGTKNSLAGDIEKGKEYTHTFEYAVPSKVQNTDNLYLVALMLDGTTGEIINAHKIKLDKVDAVTAIDATPNTNTIYNINGQQMTKANRPGLYIINGKKVVVK